MRPSYLNLWSSGELDRKTKQAREHLSACSLCPRNCRVNRLNGEKGRCGQGAKVKVAKALPHFGEEPPLSGRQGAGTVFFSGCALDCLYCQNYQISQEELGEELEVENLARLFLELQDQGCHNLDLVSPTPHLPFILQALKIAIPRGLHLPLVYNTHGYLSETTLDLLSGIIDLYLPDMKYGTNASAFRFSRVNNYAEHNQAAVRRMFHQVGPLTVNEQGLAERGLLVRHLVLPQDQSNTEEVLRVLAALSPDIPISLMAQYRPTYQASRIAEINRSITPAEYAQALALAEELDFSEIYLQDLESAQSYYPDFRQANPFESGRKE